jgi:hypothetical protein
MSNPPKFFGSEGYDRGTTAAVHVKTMIGRLEGNRSKGECAEGGGNVTTVGICLCEREWGDPWDFFQWTHFMIELIGGLVWNSLEMGLITFHLFRDWDVNTACNKVRICLLWYSKHFVAKEMWIAYICQRHSSYIRKRNDMQSKLERITGPFGTGNLVLLLTEYSHGIWKCILKCFVQ